MIKFFSVLLLCGVFVPVYAQEAVPAPSAAKSATAVDIDQLKKSFETGSTWCCYKTSKGVNRLKYVNQNTYYTPKDGELFKLLKQGDAVYAMNTKGEIMEKHWETTADFPNRFLDYKKYLADLDSQIAKIDKQLNTTKDSIEKMSARIANGKKAIDHINHEISHRNDMNRNNKSYDADKHILDRLNREKKNQQKIVKDAEKESKDGKKLLKKTQTEKDQVTAYRDKITKAAKAAGIND